MLAAYNAVKNSADKLYQNIPYVLGGRRDAYALTNQMEYFSELTECYFGLNDFYPFDHEELKEYDSAGYEMMAKVWFLSDKQIFAEHQKALKRRAAEKEKEEKERKQKEKERKQNKESSLIERLKVNEDRVVSV